MRDKPDGPGEDHAQAPLPERSRRHSRSWTPAATVLRLGPTAGLMIALALVIVGFAITQDQFLTYGNVVNILRVSAVPMIVAMGMTFVVLTSGADLSVGSAMALCGVALGMLVTAGVPVAVTLVVTVLFGALLGLVNGALVGLVRMSFFVVTLGTMAAYRGVALVLTDGRSIQVFEHESLRQLGDGSIGPAPVAVVIAASVVAVAWSASKYTVWGRSIYAVGSNRSAAALAGIRVPRIEMSAYVVSGLLAGVAAVIQVGRLTTASPVVGTGLELEVVAAVLLGGTLLSGGTGGVPGTVLGVLLIVVVSNGLSISGVGDFWQGIVTGAILILAVYLDHLQRARMA